MENTYSQFKSCIEERDSRNTTQPLLVQNLDNFYYFYGGSNDPRLRNLQKTFQSVQKFKMSESQGFYIKKQSYLVTCDCVRGGGL